MVYIISRRPPHVVEDVDRHTHVPGLLWTRVEVGVVLGEQVHVVEHEAAVTVREINILFYIYFSLLNFKDLFKAKKRLAFGIKGF